MIDIVLFEPEIPNNTGAIARTCACTGSRLHLIKPLGFDISDKAVKRAGLDYWHLVEVLVYENIDDYFEKNGDDDLWLLSTKAKYSYTPSGVAQREIRRPVPASSHAAGGQKPESLQHRRDPDLRDPATAEQAGGVISRNGWGDLIRIFFFRRKE